MELDERKIKEKKLDILKKMLSADAFLIEGSYYCLSSAEKGLIYNMADIIATELGILSNDDKLDANAPKLTKFEYDELAEEFVKSESSDNQHGAEKRTYIVCDYDSMYSTAIKLTEDQAKAIGWFIDKMGDVDEYDCYPAEECSEEV